MKKQNLCKLLVVCLGLLAFNACKDHDHDEDDTNPPVLTIENPVENAIIQGAIEIHLEATDESLHEMEIKVTKDADGSVVYEESPTVHDETDFHYEKSFALLALTGDTPLTLTVTVADHSDLTVTKTVKFIAKP